ncbi:YRB30 [[Candida] subhashii]|uniref:YRB30 n=1 Tax=[Candida] subhashii TaxID=561895 RepID=A0A8J5QJW6_9ASCO|nr:YRB30 [[Candida] subhashii]KAG7661793.1 YRB30 [[Candida] subhashii]
MDQIFLKASNQAVSFAIRSGISLASGYAIKTISSFLAQIPESAKQRIEQQRRQLKIKINIFSTAIDLIKLASARGNTVLESTVELIDDIHSQIDEFDERVNQIITQLTNKNEPESIKKVEEYMASLLGDINDAIPILNLALTVSNLSGDVNRKCISPGRLLQAANYINQGDTKNIGPSFDLVMYTIFYNPSRLKYIEGGEVDELSCITWKETFARCSVKIAVAGGGEFSYNLEVLEDFNDDRYHEDNDKPQKKTYDLSLVQRMFFTASGELLRLEGRNSPVLIIKLVENGQEEWIALGELNRGEFDDDDEDDEDNEDEEGEDIKTTKKEADKEVKHSSLSLLEYLLRLCRLQEIESKSILDIPDEILTHYLYDHEQANKLPTTIQPPQNGARKSITNENALAMDSNITRLQHLEINDPKAKK